jgi:hypothetical protein
MIGDVANHFIYPKKVIEKAHFYFNLNMGSCIETCYIFLYLVRTFMYHNKTFFFVFFKLSFSEKQLHNLT